MRNFRTMAGAAIAVAVLGLAACGSDGGGSGSSSGSDGDGGGSGDLCTNARELESLGSGDALNNLDEATFTRLTELVDGVQENAPDEIKDDVATVAQGFADVREIFAEYDYDLAKLGEAASSDPELTAQLQAFGGDDFTAASERVSTYLEEECGITSGS